MEQLKMQQYGSTTGPYMYGLYARRVVFNGAPNLGLVQFITNGKVPKIGKAGETSERLVAIVEPDYTWSGVYSSLESLKCKYFLIFE